MNAQNKISKYQTMRQTLALLLSILVIPATAPNLFGYEQIPAPVYIPLIADQLDQLVAPFALYPDPLVAQILISATYPDQVALADAWSRQNLALAADQRAALANGMAWDPAVKGLTAFPTELDNLAQNTTWMTQLGNAYFNQPEDVMNAVQAMRLQAQQAHVLVTTAQQTVVVQDGAILIAPVNPLLVAIPYYNPWRVFGGFVVAYPGFVVAPFPVGVVMGYGIGFGVGIGLGVYAGFGWGFHAWGADYGGGGVAYGGADYVSHSGSVMNHGHFGAHNAGAFGHGGRGVPGGFNGTAHGGGHAMAGSSRMGGASRSASAGGRSGSSAARSGSAAGRAGSSAGRSGSAAGRAGSSAGRSASPAGRAGSAGGRSASPAGRAGSAGGRSASPAGRAGSAGGGRAAAPAGRAGGAGGGHPATPARKGR
jgi:hypothetical protein